MGIPAKWNLTIGHLPHGPLNKISDVPGVTVGHCTLADGDVQTGVTALLPHPGDLFHEKLLAASHVQHPQRGHGGDGAGQVYAGPKSGYL